MRFAYADPPYPGCAHIYLRENPSATEVDHAALLQRLVAEYPDGWALSCNPRDLLWLLPACPDDVRVAGDGPLQGTETRRPAPPPARTAPRPSPPRWSTRTTRTTPSCSRLMWC